MTTNSEDDCGETPKNVYRLHEVQQHKDNRSTWMIIDNKVYDITEFLDEVSFGRYILITCRPKKLCDMYGHADFFCFYFW